MVTREARRARSRARLLRRAGMALGALWLLAAVGVAAGAAVGASSGEPAAEDVLSCEQLVGLEAISRLEAAGMAATESTTALFPGDSAHQCWWYDPDSPRSVYFGAGYMPADDALVASETARLLEIPSFSLDGDTLRSDGRLTATMADFVDGSWVFQAHEGYWFFAVQPRDPADGSGTESRQELDARMDGVLQSLQANVSAARAPEQPEPVEPPADPEFSADTPSTLSGLPTIAEASVNPVSVGGAVAGAIVLAALVGLPGRLVESALNARYREWASFVRPWMRPARRLGALWGRLPRAVALGTGLVVASAMATLVEPDVGFNAGSARLALSLLVGFVIESLLGLALIALWLRRRGQPSGLILRPGSLLVVLATAFISRTVGFEPGFVFGLVIAIVLVAPSDRSEAEVGAAEGLWLLVAGLGGWGLYSGVVAAGWADAGVVGLFASEALAGLTVGCLAALPLVMLPLPGLPGRSLWQRSRLVWMVAQVIGAAVFVFVVLPFPVSWQEIGVPFATWMLAFVVYAIVAVALWAVLTFTPAAWLARSPDDREADPARAGE